MMIQEEIIQLIEEAKIVTAPVTKKSNLYSDLSFDSLSFIRLLIKIEEKYSLIFEITEIEMALQVDSLIALVEKKIKEKEQ
ncbi:MAG: acyl carrier protein [Sporomusa sp.]